MGQPSVSSPTHLHAREIGFKHKGVKLASFHPSVSAAKKEVSDSDLHRDDEGKSSGKDVETL